MRDLTQKQLAKLKLLETSLGINDDGGMLLAAGDTNPALCASLKREELLQYNFMLIYQVLVVILALIVLALLGFASWRVLTGREFQAVVAGAGALISGAAANFLLKQRADARDAHAAAQKGLENHNCP
jgi:hypothetical protein